MVSDRRYAQTVPNDLLLTVATPTHELVIPEDMLANAESHAVFGEGPRPAHLHHHHVSMVTQFGTGHCVACGMKFWAGMWVVKDLFGSPEARQEYLRERLGHWIDQCNFDHAYATLPYRMADITAIMDATTEATVTPLTRALTLIKGGKQ